MRYSLPSPACPTLRHGCRGRANSTRIHSAACKPITSPGPLRCAAACGLVAGCPSIVLRCLAFGGVVPASRTRLVQQQAQKRANRDRERLSVFERPKSIISCECSVVTLVCMQQRQPLSRCVQVPSCTCAWLVCCHVTQHAWPQVGCEGPAGQCV